jgi:hypothetical protein
VKTILANGVDQLPLAITMEPSLHLPATHPHIRGPAYYAAAPHDPSGPGAPLIRDGPEP